MHDVLAHQYLDHAFFAEIFLNYGYCEDDATAHDETSWKSHIVRDYHFQENLQLLQQSRYQLAPEHRNTPLSELDTSVLEPLVAFLRKETSNSSALVQSIVPKTVQEFLQVMTTPSQPPYDSLAHRLAHTMNTVPRTPEWVRTNGICLDNLVPGKSSIPQAGQGAIAQRRLTAGEIIVPVPLLHIMDREVLTMHDNEGHPYSTQLLMNYCFGHNESSILLCPNTNAILINHCSKRKGYECGDKGPNAEYRWGTSWDPETPKCLQGSLEEMEAGDQRCVAMEVVALRDIEAGEEILIDYGERWEQAWERHVAQWKPPTVDSGFAQYVSTKELNERSEPPDFLVAGDLRAEPPVHPNVVAGCLYWTTEFDSEEEWSSLEYDPKWTEWSDEEILNYYGSDGSMFEADFDSLRETSFWPCVIIGSEDEEQTRYTVRLDGSYWGHYTAWASKNLPRFITNYPASSIRYFNKPYSSDQFLPGAFRHPIEIRDDIFPEHWRNLKN